MTAYLPPPSALPPGSTVDAYLRDSGGPRQDASTDQQRAEIELYCREHGLQLRHLFVDVARSGGSTVARDEFNRLIDSTRNADQRPHALLLWNYARFARDLDDAIYYKALLRNRNILVHSLTDPIPEGQYGRVIEFFIDISNEEKRRQTSADSKRGLRALVLEHGCIPGTPPRGFIREPVHIGSRRDGSPHVAHRWVPDPALLPTVRRAFEMRAAGATLAAIHKETHLYGAINSYKTFFINRLYIGILEFGDVVVESYCAPLVDLSTWTTVQTRVEQHSQAKYDRLHPRRANSPYLLSGLARCYRCGSPLYGSTVSSPTRGRHQSYHCSRSKRHAGCDAGLMSRRALETAVLDTLRTYILLPDSLAALLELEQHSGVRNEQLRLDRLSALQGERRKLSAQIANLTRAIAERGHSEAMLDRLQELESRRAQVLVEVRELSTLQIVVPAPRTALELETVSAAVIEALSNGTPEQIRAMLQGFIREIRAQRRGKEITGTITYYSPIHDPPFDHPPPQEGRMSLEPPSLGAPPYRHTFTHPIIHKRP